MIRFKNSDMVEVEGEILLDREKAIYFDNGNVKVWLPKSAIEISDDEKSILIRESFAQEKGLI